jgi:hypothetical protein
MDCDGLKKALILDLDGTFLETGSAGSIVAESEWEWDGDPRRGLGDFRLPVVMLTDPDDGSKIDTADLCPNKGKSKSVAMPTTDLFPQESIGITRAPTKALSKPGSAATLTITC